MTSPLKNTQTERDYTQPQFCVMDVFDIKVQLIIFSVRGAENLSDWVLAL